MNLARLLRDRRGHMIELQILVAWALLSVAVGVGERSWWKGPVYSALGLLAVFGGLMAVVFVVESLEKVPAIGRFLDSRLASLLGAGAAYLLGLVGGAAAGGFVAMLAAPHLAATPEGQLRAMQAITAAGAAAGGLLVRWERGRPARF